MSPRLALPLLLVLASPATALAAPGYAVCMAVDAGAQGRVLATAQPFARESGRAEADAPGFASAARSQGKSSGELEPACHWEPSREKAADYLRRLRQGAGRKGSEAVEVAYAPAG